MVADGCLCFVGCVDRQWRLSGAMVLVVVLTLVVVCGGCGVGDGECSHGGDENRVVVIWVSVVIVVMRIGW